METDAKLNDHEARIRALERGFNRIMGGLAIITVLIPLLTTLLAALVIPNGTK